MIKKLNFKEKSYFLNKLKNKNSNYQEDIVKEDIQIKSEETKGVSNTESNGKESKEKVQINNPNNNILNLNNKIKSKEDFDKIANLDLSNDINNIIYSEIQKTHNIQSSQNPIWVTNISNLQVNISQNNPIAYYNSSKRSNNDDSDSYKRTSKKKYKDKHNKKSNRDDSYERYCHSKRHKYNKQDDLKKSYPDKDEDKPLDDDSDATIKLTSNRNDSVDSNQSKRSKNSNSSSDLIKQFIPKFNNHKRRRSPSNNDIDYNSRNYKQNLNKGNYEKKEKSEQSENFQLKQDFVKKDIKRSCNNVYQDEQVKQDKQEIKLIKIDKNVSGKTVNIQSLRDLRDSKEANNLDLKLKLDKKPSSELEIKQPLSLKEDIKNIDLVNKIQHKDLTENDIKIAEKPKFQGNPLFSKALKVVTSSFNKEKDNKTNKAYTYNTYNKEYNKEYNNQGRY